MATMAASSTSESNSDVCITKTIEIQTITTR